MYGYIDESGASGAVQKQDDWLVVSLVLFETNDQKLSAEKSLRSLRSELDLKSSYEFHRAHNSPRIRNAVERKLKNIDFTYIAFAYKKTRRKEDASYKLAAQEIIAQIEKYTESISILTDTNPTLLKHLNKMAKQHTASQIKVSSEDSRKSLGLQIADYVVNICSHRLKDENNAAYRKIRKKELDFLITADYKGNSPK